MSIIKQQQREFNPLTGPEIVQVIGREVMRELEASGEFGAMIAYPQVDWSFSLTMHAYDNEGSLINATAGGRFRNPDARKAITIEYERPFVRRPDLVREEMGLSSIETGSAHGITFDEQVPGTGIVKPKEEATLERRPIQRVGATVQFEEDAPVIPPGLAAAPAPETGRVDFGRGIDVKRKAARGA